MATEFDFEYYTVMMMPDIQNTGKGTNTGETGDHFSKKFESK